MTWKDFKRIVEEQGVKDEMAIVSMSFIGKSLDENIELIVNENDFSVYGVSKQLENS